MLKIKQILICMSLLGCITLMTSCSLRNDSAARSAGSENSTVTIRSTANRLSGVAPLSVFFDATDTTSSLTNRPFDELEYRWNFGDTDTPWTTGIGAGTSSKNQATGAIAAHVYESNGDFSAILTVTDGTNVATKKFLIHVDKPDDVFLTNTTCISTGTDFSAAPNGSTNVTSSDFSSAIANALAAGARRILFKRGDSFSVTANMNQGTTGSTVGPILIGAFGSGNRPRLVAATGSEYAFSGYNINDWRIMDLEFDGQSLGNGMVGINGRGTNVTVLRVYGHGMGDVFALAASPGAEAVPGYNAYVDCSSSNIIVGQGKLSAYLQDFNQLFVSGCSLDNSGGGEYNARFQGGYKLICSNNTFGRGGDNKSSVTFRGDGNVPIGTLGYISRYYYISDNVFDSRTSVGHPWAVSITPTNSLRGEQIHDAVFERNYLVGGETPQLLITACNVTVRNNLFNHTTTTATSTSLVISWVGNTGGLPPIYGIHVFNNSFYASTSAGYGESSICIYNQGSLVSDTVVKNNLAYIPYATKSVGGSSGPEILYDQGSGTIADHNSSNTQVNTISPYIGSMPSSDPSDWKLASGSYASGSGTPVPVWSDFYLNPLTSSTLRNLGAIQ
jgi:hypothetical protein